MNLKMMAKMAVVVALCLCIIDGYAQNILPEHDVISGGVGITAPMGSSKNDFTDLHRGTLSFTANANYRHYLSEEFAVGVMYQFHGSHSGRDLLRCHYIAPTATFRFLDDDMSQSWIVTCGAGYFKYGDRIGSRASINHTFSRGYFGASLSVGREFALSRHLSTQLHLDVMMADWVRNEDYEPKWLREDPDDFQTMFDPNMMFISLGVDIQFGR